MRLKRKILILLLLFFFKINAQKFELGKVTIAELEEETHPKDPAAVAAILFSKGEVHFEYSQTQGFQMITVVKNRIKIYKKEGYEWANQKVDYYIPNDFNEVVYFSDAVTYNLVDGKIVKTKLKGDGEFDQQINKYWGQKKITLPNVKEGSVLEFEYKIVSPGIGSMKDWNFQTSIPVNYSEFKTYIPEYYVYKPSQKGFVFPKVTVESNPKSFVINSSQRTGGYGLTAVSTTFSNDKIDYVETKTTYIAENLPAMKEEAFVNNVDNYTSSISHELALTKYPNQPYKPYSTDWETVTKKIYENEDFGPELNKTGYFDEQINELIKVSKTQDELSVAIFQFVKAHVKWNKNYGYSCNEGVKTAYKNKIGNVAEINLMLTAMLRYAGINANPVLVSTRSNGVALFPSRNAFNYVISAIETQNGIILLDATDVFSTPNVLPLRDLNWFGRLIRKDGTSLQIDLMPKKLSKASLLMNFSINSEGIVEGTIKVQYTDHLALNFRQKSIGANIDDYLEKLENENNSIEISDYVRENELEIGNPIIESYSFKGSKDIEIINDKIYISPLLFLTVTENPFKQEVREYPIDFGYPSETKQYINIEIPEGYAIESLPKNLNATTGDGIGAFKYSVGNSENKIQLAIISSINTAIVSSEYYDVIKDFYKLMIEKQNEKIVLKKI